MSFPLPERGDPRRTDALFSHAAMIRAIAYTNILHLSSGDPHQWIRDNAEIWNRQVAYAELIIDSLIEANWIQVRKYQ